MNLPEGDSPPDTMRATSRGRVLSAALLVLALAVLAFFQLYVLPSVQSSLRPPFPPNAVTSLKFLFAGFSALAILPAIAMIAVGRKILRSGQCPPPDAWVWRDTRIKRGREAIRMAWICIVSGALAALACAALAAYIWIMFDRVIPQHQLRPGVTILQEQFASKP